MKDQKSNTAKKLVKKEKELTEVTNKISSLLERTKVKKESSNSRKRKYKFDLKLFKDFNIINVDEIKIICKDNQIKENEIIFSHLTTDQAKQVRKRLRTFLISLLDCVKENNYNINDIKEFLIVYKKICITNDFNIKTFASPRDTQRKDEYQKILNNIKSKM